MHSSAIGRLPLFLIVVTPAVWSTNYLVARYAPQFITPHLLAFLRWLFAFIIMLPFAYSELKRLWPQWRQEWPQIFVLGALGMWICGAFVYIGGETTTAVNIGLLYTLAPVLVAIISARLLNESLRAGQWFGLVLSVVGVVIVVVKGSWQNLIGVRLTTGDVWIMVAVVSWATYSVLLKQRSSALSPFSRITVITAGGLLVLLPFTAVEVMNQGLPADWSHALIICLVAAVLPGLVAYQSYAYLQQQVGASRAGLVLYLGPLYTALLAWWLLGEPPQWYHLVGAALILPGMYLAMSAGGAAASQTKH
ncbi:MAG: DMT family transporter [Pseudomonadota bacterium]